MNTETLRCLTPGCGLNASRSSEEMFPSGPFTHDEEPPFPHEVNDPGVDPRDAEIAQLRVVLDQLVFDALMAEE